MASAIYCTDTYKDTLYLSVLCRYLKQILLATQALDAGVYFTAHCVGSEDPWLFTSPGMLSLSLLVSLDLSMCMSSHRAGSPSPTVVTTSPTVGGSFSPEVGSPATPLRKSLLPCPHVQNTTPRRVSVTRVSRSRKSGNVSIFTLFSLHYCRQEHRLRAHESRLRSPALSHPLDFFESRGWHLASHSHRHPGQHPSHCPLWHLCNILFLK